MKQYTKPALVRRANLTQITRVNGSGLTAVSPGDMETAPV